MDELIFSRWLKPATSLESRYKKHKIQRILGLANRADQFPFWDCN